MSGRRESGYSVIELLIALALVTVIVIGAAQLIAESVVLLDRAGRAVRNPSLTLAAAAVRRDVQGAVALACPPPVSWTQTPLEVLDWEGRRTGIRHEGDALVRITYGVDGFPKGRRVLTRGVVSWWWRVSGPGAVDVRLTALAVPGPGAGRGSGTFRLTETRRFALRGAGGGRRW